MKKSKSRKVMLLKQKRGEKTNIPYLAQESDLFSVCYLLSRGNIHTALEDHPELSLDSYLYLIVGLL